MSNYSSSADFSSEFGADDEHESKNQSFYSPAYGSKPASEDDLLGDIEASAARQLSVVGQTLVFKGKLEAKEDLLIQGRVEGSIKHDAQNLTIGAHGDVKANIEAHKIIVQGKVEGDMWASESVIVETSARVIGNIFAPRIAIKEGAKFKGSIDMDFDGKAPSGSAKPESKAAAKPKSSSAQQKSASKSKTDTDADKLSDNKVDELLD
jgi:cytoskeletal protein CcmA (bactofilin family)